MDSFFKLFGVLFFIILLVIGVACLYNSYYSSLEKQCATICGKPGQVEHNMHGSDKCYCEDSKGNLVLKKVFE